MEREIRTRSAGVVAPNTTPRTPVFVVFRAHSRFNVGDNAADSPLILLLCQRESVAPTASRVDFDSDSLPFVQAFRESWPVEVDRSISCVDAHPASFALGVFNVSCYRDKRHNKTLQRDCQPARCGSLILVHGFRWVDVSFTRWQPLSFGRYAAGADHAPGAGTPR